MSELRAAQGETLRLRGALEALATALPPPVAALAALRAEHAASQQARVAALVARAARPPETRLVNETTALAIFALRDSDAAFLQDLAVAEVSAAAAAAQAADAAALAAASQAAAAALAAVETDESAQRAVCAMPEADARKRIASAAREHLKKVASHERQQQRHSAKNTADAKAAAGDARTVAFVAFVQAAAAGSAADAAEDACEELADDEEAARADAVEAETLAWRALEAAARAAGDAVADAGGRLRVVVARVPLLQCGAVFAAEPRWVVSDVDGPRVTLSPVVSGDVAAARPNVTVFACALAAFAAALPVEHLRLGAEAVPVLLPMVHPPRDSVAVFLAHGGYFAGAVVDATTNTVVVHKTIQRYITRRGQGGRQSSHGGRTDTAGSQLRAAMETKWMAECAAVVDAWAAAGHLARCALLLWHAPGPVNERMLVRSTALGKTEDVAARTMRLPINTSRPTLAECTYAVSTILGATVRTTFVGEAPGV